MPLQAKSRGSGILPVHSQLGIRRSWVGSTTIPMFCALGKAGTLCTRDWVILENGLEGMQSPHPSEIRSPDRTAREDLLYRLCYSINKHKVVQI